MKKNTAILSILAALVVGIGGGFAIKTLTTPPAPVPAAEASANTEIETEDATTAAPLSEEAETIEEAPAEEADVPTVDYRGIVGAFAFEDAPVYVIGHMSPDCDTVCSAIAYAALKRELGLDCEARVAGKINNQTKYVLEYFGVEVPELLEDAAGKQIILVDHSAYEQAVNGMEDARIVELLDHHNLDNVQTALPIYVKTMPIGATATIVYTSYIECGVPIDKPTAGILLGAILSDTGYLKGNNATEYDKTAAAALTKIAELEDLDAFCAKLREADISFDGMTPEEIMRSDYKEYSMGGKKVGIGCFTLINEEKLDELLLETLPDAAEALRVENGVDYLYCCANVPEYTVGKVAAYGDGAEELGVIAFEREPENGLFVFAPSEPRKTYFVPRLTEAIENSEKE